MGICGLLLGPNGLLLESSGIIMGPSRPLFFLVDSYSVLMYFFWDLVES